MYRYFIISILLVLSNFAGNSQDTLNNKNIIELVKVGLGKSTIISKINSSYPRFDLSIDSLIYLKKSGVQEEIVTAMINKDTEVRNAKPSSLHSVGNTDIKSGIYYCEGDPCKFKELEPSVYSSANSGSGLLTAITYGVAKTNSKAMLSGKEANLQIPDSLPSFYFYFDQSQAGTLSGSTVRWFQSATSPNEFVLVKFKISSNKKNREVVTGSWNSYQGMTSGIDDVQRVEFKYQKISSGVYKVYFLKSLNDGEYCFMYAGAASEFNGMPVQKVFDFGVNTKKTK